MIENVLERITKYIMVLNQKYSLLIENYIKFIIKKII